MSEANKNVVRRLYAEVMGKGKTSVADEIFDPDTQDGARSGRRPQPCKDRREGRSEGAAPWVHRRSSLGVAMQEMVEHVEEFEDMRLVSTSLGCPNVVNDHVADRIQPFLGIRQIAGEASGNDLGHMLVLGNCQDFLLTQAAHPDAVLQTNHLDPA